MERHWQRDDEGVREMERQGDTEIKGKIDVEKHGERLYGES